MDIGFPKTSIIIAAFYLTLAACQSSAPQTLSGSDITESSKYYSCVSITPSHDDICVDVRDYLLFKRLFAQSKNDKHGSFDATTYYAQGTYGQHIFRQTERMQSAQKFGAFVESEWPYYQVFISQDFSIEENAGQLTQAVSDVSRLLGRDTKPDIFFTVGQTFSGGTANHNSIIIGLETFSVSPNKTSYGRPTIDADLLVPIVAHETIHAHQAPHREGPVGLDTIIREGSADYIGELVAGPDGRLINSPDLYPYGFRNYDRVTERFQKSLDVDDFSEWLYSDKTPLKRDIGYFAGYCISKLFMEQVGFSRQALNELVEMTNPYSILERSQFLDGAVCSATPATLKEKLE